MTSHDTTPPRGPMDRIDDWEQSLALRFPIDNRGKPKEAFRDYRAQTRPSVKEFYRLNHARQTFSFVLDRKREYLPLRRKEMGVWEAMEFLNTLVDDSDPDTELSQIEHLLQSAEAIRRDGHPRWFILTGLVHDLGKILCLFGEPQWAVVGDTFPVGCAYSDEIVFHEFFAENPDSARPELQTLCGVYEAGCGLANVHMSWGHDEYMYHVARAYLPEPALYMIRYHSFYAAHTGNAYGHLMNDHDRRMFAAVRAFNRYDLYSKADVRPRVDELRPYYEELIAEFFPEKVLW